MSTSLLLQGLSIAAITALIVQQGQTKKETGGVDDELKKLQKQLEESKVLNEAEREKMIASLQQAQDELAKQSEEEQRRRLKEETEKIEERHRQQADAYVKEKWNVAKHNYFLHAISDCPSWGANDVCCDRKSRSNSTRCSLFQPCRIDTKYMPTQNDSFDMLCRQFSDSEAKQLNTTQSAVPDVADMPNEISLSNKSGDITNVCHAVATSSCPINLHFVDKITARVDVKGDCSNTLASMLTMRRADNLGLRAALHALVSCPARNEMIMATRSYDFDTEYDTISKACDISSGTYKVQFDVDRDSSSVNATVCSAAGFSCDGKCSQSHAMKTSFNSPVLLTSSISSNVESDNVWRKILGKKSLQHYCMTDQVNSSPATCTYEISNLKIERKPGSKMSEVFPNNNPDCYYLVR